MNRSWNPALLTAPAALLVTVAGSACNPDAPTQPAGAAGPGLEAALTIGRVFVDQSGSTGFFTSLVASSSGRQHISYYDISNRDLRYATCAAGCTTAGNWSTGVVDFTGDVGRYTSLEVRSGVRHLIYLDVSKGDLKYAFCSAACTAAASWQRLAVDQAGAVGSYASLAVAADGRRHVSYHDESNGALKYATCLSGCGQAGNWQKLAIDQAGDVGKFTSIAVGPDGRRHIAYYDFGNTALKYAACLTNCTNAANWQTLTVDGVGSVGLYTSMAVDADGVLHLSYYDASNGDLRYARCAVDCTITPANWPKVTVDATNSRGLYTSLAVGTDGRVHVSYYDLTNGDLRYATCAVACLGTTSWQRSALDGQRGLVSPDVGTHSSLAVAGGSVHVSYHDETNTALKYLERSP